MDRKRASSSEEGGGSASGAKRLHLDAGSEDPEYDLLEQFRKEAIYRQLREVTRDAQRMESSTRSLEKDIERLQRSVLSVNQFWDLLKETLSTLQIDEQILGDALHSTIVTTAPLALSQSADQHESGLRIRADLIRDLLARLAAFVAPKSTDMSDALKTTQERIVHLATESSSLRSALDTAYAQLNASQDHAARVTEELRALQRHSDRQSSKSVQSVEDPLGKARADAESAQIAAADAERAEAERRKLASDAAAPTDGNAIPLQEATAEQDAIKEQLVMQQELATSRLDQVEELRKDMNHVQQELTSVQRQWMSIPDERITHHPLYQQVLAEMQFLQQETDRIRSDNRSLEQENEQLREFRLEFQHQTTTQANTHSDELQKQLRLRDTDIVRLRGQRDELNAELLERRARDTIKFAQVDELKAVISPKDERIEQLKAQVHRLSMLIAALRGDHRTVNTLLESEPDVNTAHLLEEKLKQVEEEKAALQITADPTEMQRELAQLRELVQKPKQLVGEGESEDQINESVSYACLKQTLAQTQSELAAANASTSSLYDEVDRLSIAYDQLEKHAEMKLVNLAKLEDKILRLTTEKSKADNKYFAAMRAKDAMEAELRTVSRSAERQSKVIERYTDAEKGLQSQLTQSEKEISTLRKALQVHATKLAEHERDRSSIRRRLAEVERARQYAETNVTQQIASINEERGAKVRAEERATILDKEASRLKRRLADRENAGMSRKRSQGDDDTHLAYLDSLLKCSACKERYRDRIITKCLHTFCEACVNARIQTRQRKCPHCGLSFAISDVQVLYCK
ncbi:RING-type E3 ubiquitin transferase [Malassezia yamatoensis]|uniref:E3 ubiquitin protein ligase n=1 Tax=Malassezia yamatoensis TaxID=253288 RepID=A0AAJ5Z1X6_9BASI|nr:RING-type E3 ubiquitin transferase [Malassezia yamatoensis]